MTYIASPCLKKIPKRKSRRRRRNKKEEGIGRREGEGGRKKKEEKEKKMKTQQGIIRFKQHLGRGDKYTGISEADPVGLEGLCLHFSC